MARARKSHKRDEEKIKIGANGLELPYGQPGQNKYVIYCDYDREDLSVAKVLVLNFRAKYAAKFFLNQLIADNDWEWDDPIGSRDCIKTSLGIRISAYDHLEELLAYDPTDDEAEWRDEQVERHVQRFKYGRAEPLKSHEDNEEERPKKVKAERQPKEKIDREGKITANDIAKEFEVEGSEVRKILRKMKLEKPAGGWLFDPKTAEEIRVMVRKGLKAEAKRKAGKK